MAKKQTSLWIEIELLEKIKAFCQKKHWSITTFIHLAAENMLKEGKK